MIEAVDTTSDAPRRERGERSGERGEGARRERGGRRNERRPTDDTAEGNAQVASDNSTATDGAPADAPQDGQEPARNGGQRRSRDRYGRERRGRGDSADAGQGDSPVASTEGTGEGADITSPAAPAVDIDAPVRSYFTRAQVSAPAASDEVAAEPPTDIAPLAEAPAPQPRPAPVETTVATPAVTPAAEAGLPKVQPFTLEIDALASIAQASGLVWVHSDGDKVQQAQAAIAAEPKPIHVPREPKPVVAMDDGPLVLVETRRDLRNMVLPFEQNNSTH